MTGNMRDTNNDFPSKPAPQIIDQSDFGAPNHQVIEVDDEPLQGDGVEEDIEFISDDDDDDEDDDDEVEEDENYEDSDAQAIDEAVMSNQAAYHNRNVAAETQANVVYPATDTKYWFSKLSPIDPDYPIKASNHYTWEVPKFETLTEQKYTSPNFKCGGIDFHILFFPQGNDSNSLALYLAPQPASKVDPETGKAEPIDPDWVVCAQFGLMIWNPDDPRIRYFNQSSHRFNAEEPDWGFANFINISQLTTKAPASVDNPKGHGFLNKDHRLNITCFVNVIEDTTGVLWHSFNNYDSRKETGFTGLKNQGATCYLNSLLQSYYFTRIFRKAVFQIPSDTSSAENFTLALQRLFYYLQVNNDAVDTNELTRSFGWDAADSFQQHDVQELNRILMDRLEAKMKGTVVEDSLNKSFVGKMKSYIKCVNVDYESSRLEDFWDIQLNVKNLKNLGESFENYIAKEMLDGENKYDAGANGLQDAEKGVVFEEFPNVLHLQLKRFDYDYMYDSLVKINDRHEFPEFIDLKPYLDTSNTKAMSEDWEYELYAVLIHSGDISSGHYYAMIKPDANSGWFRFDDDKVLRVTHNEVFEENFGHNKLATPVLQKMTRSQYNDYQIKRHTSAYMLVYFRKSKLNEVLCDFDVNRDIPYHIRDTIENERQAAIRKRRELEESHFYLKVHLYGANDSFFNYQGFDLGVNRYNGGLITGKWNGHIYENPGELVTLENSDFSKQSKDSNYLSTDYSHFDSNLSNPPKLLKILKKSTIKELYEDVINNHANLKNPGIEAKYVRLWMLAHRKNETTRPDIPLGYSRENGVVVSSDEDNKISVKTQDGKFSVNNIPEHVTVEQIHERFSAKKNFGLYLWVEDTRNDLGNIYRFGRAFVANDEKQNGVGGASQKSAGPFANVDSAYNIADKPNPAAKANVPETSTKLGLLPEIPRNFLEFPKLFGSIHELIDAKLNSASVSNEEKEKIANMFKPVPVSSTSTEILIFVKYFDPENQTLTGFSHLVISKFSQIDSIVPIINYLMGYDRDTPLKIYEEIKPTSIEAVKQTNNFLVSELQTGDILIFTPDKEQISSFTKSKISKFEDIRDFEKLSDESPVKVSIGNGKEKDEVIITKRDVVTHRDKLIDNVLVKSADVQNFYRYMKSRMHIYLRPAKKLEGDESYVAISDVDALASQKQLNFQFWVDPQTTYTDIATALGAKLNVDPNVIRLFIVPFKDGGNIALKKRHSIGMLIHKSFNLNSTLTFEYEILNISLDELENLKMVKISWLPSGVLHEHFLEFLVDKNATIDALLDKFIAKLAKSNDKVTSKNKLLAWRVNQNRISKTYSLQDTVEYFPNKTVLYVRPLEDSEELDFNDLLYNNPGLGSREGSSTPASLSDSGSSSAAAVEAVENPVKKNLNSHIAEVVQFSKDPSRPHGIPFHFILLKDEPFSETKKRLQAKLALGVKEFSKAQIGLINKKTNGNMRYCNKDEVVLFDEITVDDAIFLDHPDRAQHRANYGGGAIFIKD